MIDAIQKAAEGIRGRLTPGAPLAPYTWLRVGGAADALFAPADEADLRAFLAALPPEVPVAPVGVGSNLLVRDGGVAGVVIRLGRGFGALRTEGARLTAGAAALDAKAAQAAAEAGIGGLEFLRGVPGTIGGAVRMNAGCYGTEARDRLLRARVVFRDGSARWLETGELGLRYRHSDLPPDAIVTEAVFQGASDAPQAIAARMAALTARREETQPIREKTGGSTFRNPDGESAWRLIDAAGCRGLRIGDAQISEKHCNFLINLGSARAADLEAVGEEARRRVRAATGHDLVWEIKRIGRANGP